MKKILLALALQTIINIFIALFVIYNVEKHSTHPVHGIDKEKVRSCMPWDAC